jgi:hypothetical protein
LTSSYEDGTRRSNRKVPRALTCGTDGDKRAHGFLIEQDRDIAEKSGKPPAKIKSITRSGAKKARDLARKRPDKVGRVKPAPGFWMGPASSNPSRERLAVDAVAVITTSAMSAFNAVDGSSTNT